VAVVERRESARESPPDVRLASPEEPQTRDVLTFSRRRPPRRPAPDIRWSDWARHVIICVDDAFPVGTVQSLDAADPEDCFAIIDTALDAGQGSRYLRSPSIWSELRAEFVQHGGPDYDVLAYHIAPTHAHVLIREAQRFSLDATVERWKAVALSTTSDRRAYGRWIWAPGYYDETLEDPAEIEAARIAIDFHTPGVPRRPTPDALSP
jgi:hypothetical protein